MLTYDELKKLFGGQAGAAWLVGGGARTVLGMAPSPPNDWDVILESNRADRIKGLQGQLCQRNAFGGFHFPLLGLDLWTGVVSVALETCRWHEKAVAINLKTGAVIGTREFFAGMTGEPKDRPFCVPPPGAYPKGHPKAASTVYVFSPDMRPVPGQDDLDDLGPEDLTPF